MSIVELEDVSFQYKGSKEGSLVNVNLNIEQGQTVLLCGASGQERRQLSDLSTD